ncbi:HEPN domain-containing protein [Tenacibaculum amylolyticum]|uniref:HEPN domain-containing protein n=1 Tax=Tenacibaculum amylolyticum TaxID=104269 RepID=UPI0038950E2E
MNEPIPKLEPLSDNLKDLDIGEFLKSREFKRYCIKAGLDGYWRDLYNHVKNNRTYLSLGMDHEKYDSIDALNLLLNNLYQDYNNQFYNFIKDFLYAFSNWTNETLNLRKIVEDLELLNCPKEILEVVSNLDNFNTNAVPKSDIPDIVDNARKLEESLEKMDGSIRNNEFNLTLTYAYSCLEGIFKAYVENKQLPESSETELSKLSKAVKTNLKQHFEENGKKYPEQMLNLISTITNAVSNARNNFSESHFDKNSDKWLAEFARDCVNSIGRLILKFVE